MAQLRPPAAKTPPPADQSRAPWRPRNGCVPHSRSVIARLRILRQAGCGRLGPRASRAYVDRADEAPWVRAQDGDWGALITQLMGAQAAPRIARHPHQRFRAQFQPTSTRRPWRARLQESNDENLSEHLHHWLVGFDGHVEPGDGADGVNRRSAT